MKNYEFWFIVGSQTLYGEDVLTTVAQRAEEMAQKLSAALPYPLKYKVTAKSSAEITQVVKEVNYDDSCAGIITWCHTFSPSKMWINGLDLLQKPWLHFATQYNREIPNEEIDMDFMNLNQAAHGDREHGFIGARLRKPRKIIAGYWQDSDVQARIGSWMKAAIGVAVSKDMKVMRFGDNMRNVAVTEGDKVEVQKKLGWEVNTWAVGDLVKEMNAVSEAEIDGLMAVYREKYDIATDDIAAVRYQAREEIAMKKMMDAEGCKAFSNTFQALYGMEQLPCFSAPDGTGLRLRRRGRLEGRGHDRNPESHGRKRQRRVRIHGGLHLSPRQGSGIFPRRAHAGGLPVRCCGPSAHRDALPRHRHERKGPRSPRL